LKPGEGFRPAALRTPACTLDQLLHALDRHGVGDRCAHAAHRAAVFELPHATRFPLWGIRRRAWIGEGEEDVHMRVLDVYISW